MTDKEKLKKIKELADKMYSRMAYLTSDTRPIREAMEEYHKFIVHEYNEKEPVSEIDFEQELYKAFGYVKDFTLGMRIASRFYEMGRNHQEPTSDDLEQAIDTYLATYFGGEKEKQDWPFLKKMAIHFANWQKEQMMKDAVEATVTDIRTYKHENEVDFTIMLDKGIIPYETEEELKLIIIKED